MSRENTNGGSLNSAYLSEFRKRKNQLLAAEIDPYEDDDAFAGNFSEDSAYLEAFRRRKNALLAAELQGEEEFFPDEGGISQPESEGGKRFRRRGPEGEEGAEMPGGLPEGQPPAPAFSNDKRRNGKIAISLALLVIAVCGVFLISKMKRDSVTDQNRGGSDIVSAVSRSDEHSDVSSGGSAPDGDAASSTTAETTSTTTEASTTTTEAPVYKTLRKGSAGDEVMKMQQRLYKLGYITEDSCTGYYGDYTTKKIKLFQKKAGLKQTGVADPTTLARLYADDAPEYSN